jgi:hypothetical protein
VPLSKSGVRKHRGFESRPLRQTPRPTASDTRRHLGRGRLVDYGAALEMRFGETRRGFESRPLRHHVRRGDDRSLRCRPRALTHARWRVLVHVPTPPRHRPSQHRTPMPTRRSPIPPPQPAIDRALLSFRSRARRGTSGALNLQSAIAGLNSLPRSPSPNAARRRDVEDRVPRSGEPRTVSGPEGSSTKRSSSGAAERPGPSRSSRWARERPGRRRVHGISIPRVRRERRRS